MYSFEEAKGWAGAYKGQSAYVHPLGLDDVTQVIEYAVRNKLQISSVGSSNSLGDSVVNSNNLLVSMRNFREITQVDFDSGILEVECGATVREVLYRIFPLGWMLRAIPGTLNATIGGCISNNVHGKDSLHCGNFGNHVIWFDILLASGEVLRSSRNENQDLFFATIGGIGLTGIIFRAAIQLYKIQSPYLDCVKICSTSLEETYYNIKSFDNYDFAQVWLDSTFMLGNCGKGITMASKFQESENFDFSNIDIGSSLEPKTKFLGLFPTKACWRSARHFFYPPFIEFVNDVYWRKSNFSSSVTKGHTSAFHKYYFFHNVIGDFYSTYNPPGFLEMQVFIPENNGLSYLESLCYKIKEAGLISVLSGMKKTIADDFCISFSGNGVTVSYAFPVRGIGVRELTRRLGPIYELVADFGGKINLSKDQAMPADVFKKCYPRYNEFTSVKFKYDPTFLFANDMSRRLCL